MGRRRNWCNWCSAKRSVEVGKDIEDLEFEADYGADLVERIRDGRQAGRDVFLETDVDFDG